METPPQVTAATGLDALTHAVESYISIKAMPLTDAYAISAIKRILKWLTEAFQDGGNKRAREEMAAAAWRREAVSIILPLLLYTV